MKKIIFILLTSILSLRGQSVFWQDDFSNPAQWNLNVNLGTSVTPNQGSNDPKYNLWEINNLNYFTPSGPISGNSLKITIQPGTDFDGLGLAPGYTGYDPFNVNEPNQTDAIAILNTPISTIGKTGIILQFDYQTGGWLGEDYGTVIYSIDGGNTWIELDNSILVDYNTLDANGNPVGIWQSKPAAPANTTDQNAFSNIDGVASGSYWHTAKITLPPACDNQPDLRIGFRWRNIVHTTNSPDYVGVSFNIDNIKLLVNPPVASFTVPTSICAGELVTFDASSSSPGGGTSIVEYLWELPGTPTPNLSTNSPTINVSYNAPGQYYPKLRVVNNNNDTSDYYIITVDVGNCAPKAIIIGPTQVCKDSTAIFYDGSLNMSSSYAPLSWNWTFNSATPNSATTQGPHSVVWNTIGKYDVALQVYNNYGNDITILTVDVIDCSCNKSTSPVRLFFEDFGTSCIHTGYTTPKGYTWTIENVGTQGPDANTWYISGQENGNGAGNCGSGCSTPANATLHVGSTTLGDIGAAYDAGGCLFGFISCTQTNKRISTPVSTASHRNIIVNFEYIEYGDGSFDNAVFTYSTDGGTTWNDVEIPKSTCCGGGCNGFNQGLWTTFSIDLSTIDPAVENNPNLIIGFRWQNNDDGFGTDPSFAVDNVEVWGEPTNPITNVFTGNISNDWHTSGNWSLNTIPTINDNVEIPAGKTAIISTQPAEGGNVCNFGTIEIQNDFTLSIGQSLLNEGTIRTTTINQQPDVIFTGTNCVYKGAGVNIDTDYEIANTSSTTLEANLSCRTFVNNGNLIWTGKTITLHRNLIINSTTSTNDLNSTIILNGPCNSCLDNSTTQDMTGTAANFNIPNLIINKPTGTVNILNTFDVSNTLNIKNGIVIQPTTGLLTGTADFYMSNGEYRIANLSPIIIPNLFGVFSITGGKIKLDGNGDQLLKPANYFKLHFAGTGIKILSGNVNVKDSLIFDLPPTIGNYIDAQNFTLTELSNDPFIVTRTGGHVVGNFARAVKPANKYMFYVGATGNNPTFYEPIEIATSPNFSGPTTITVKFNDAIPNPNTITPPLQELGANFSTLETEGFWSVTPDNPLTTGTYDVTLFPSQGWTFTSTSYTQVKQSATTQPWSFGTSSRITALKRTGYSSFSNFAIASSPDPLPQSITLQGIFKYNHNLLSWNLNNSIINKSIELQRSMNKNNWNTILSTTDNKTKFKDFNIKPNSTYFYRIILKEENGSITYSNVVTIKTPQYKEDKISIFPNPFENNITITSNNNEIFSIQIYNSIGKLLISHKNIKRNITINTKKLPQGMYILKITTEDGSIITKKITKSN